TGIFWSISPFSRNSSVHPPPLFIHQYSNHRDLHSFPTRRSSDLARGDEHHVRALERLLDVVARLRGGGQPHVGVRARRQGGAQRSEEHTSELQSRENLVCRLLLEKKK